ncbi:MAG: hypothetical protein ACNYWU_06610 [Desulfobacterales bacterium]
MDSGGFLPYNHHKGKTRLDHVKKVAWLSFFWANDFDQKAFFKHSIVDSLKHKLIYIYTRYHLFQIERVMQ